MSGPGSPGQALGSSGGIVHKDSEGSDEAAEHDLLDRLKKSPIGDGGAPGPQH